jgi:hypothetical protein
MRSATVLLNAALVDVRRKVISSSSVMVVSFLVGRVVWAVIPAEPCVAVAKATGMSATSKLGAVRVLASCGQIVDLQAGRAGMESIVRMKRA